MEWNHWTKAERFLLIEKLSSSTQAEERAEIAAQCDSRQRLADPQKPTSDQADKDN